MISNLIVAPKDRAWADQWHRNDFWVERSAACGMSRIELIAVHSQRGALAVTQLISSLLVLFCLVSTPVRGADARNADLERLQGMWELTSFVDEGVTAPVSPIRGSKVVFSRNQMTLVAPDGNEKTTYTIKLDPTKTPNAMDIINTEGSFKGETNRGIYEVEGETLRLCAPHRPTTDRPSTFAAPQGSGLFLMVFKKVKN